MANRPLDLGNITEPLLVFGGPYSNLQATRALREQAQKLGIPAGRTICTGDVVAYCASPNETIAELKSWGCHILQGNCEVSLGQSEDDCGCGFDQGSACSLLSVQWYQYANAKVTTAERHWMRSLPSLIELGIGPLRAVVVHGAVSGINRFIFPSAPSSQLLAEIEQSQASIVLAGHSGLPFTRKLITAKEQIKYWHNAGVIGMPANDGQASVWYSVITPGDEKNPPVFEHFPLNYDAGEAQQAMHRCGLSNGYADALVSGLWPSVDILPDVERQHVGKPIIASQCLQAQ